MRSPGRRALLIWLAALAVLAVALAASITLTRSPGGAAAKPDASSPKPPASSALVSVTPSPPPVPSASPSPSLPPRPPDDRPGPVILIPGYGGDTAMLAGLAARLQAAGRTTITLALPDGATGDLRDQEKVLAARAHTELAKGAASVDLIGYSAGGIVAALYVAAEPSSVRRVVTLGSPLHGTRLAGLAAGLLPSACPVACQQMAPGSALLDSLAAASPRLTGVPWLSLWTAHDEVVTPPSSARFDGARNIELQDICPDDAATHITLPDDPLATGLTIEALSGPAAIPSPRASECAALRALAR